MLLTRYVFQAKYGRGDELVKLLQEGHHMWSDYQPRLLTDASGPFFTVVLELTYENFADYEAAQARELGHDDFQPWFEKMMPLVDSGRREYYHIVASS